jgi:hypothetical protein
MPARTVSPQSAGIEILKRVKEEEPPKPITGLSSSRDRLASIAAVRGTEPGRLTRSLCGDLDWIVMKALKRAWPGALESASGFARDVQLSRGVSVEACPPSTGYSTRSRTEGDGRSPGNQCCNMKADLATIGPEATLKARRCVGRMALALCHS